MMRRIMKWMMVVVMASGGLVALGYGAYLKRDLIAVWLGQAEAKPELSATPLFKQMDRFVISLEGGAQPHYLVLELAVVTHNPAQLSKMGQMSPLIRNTMVQYFSHRSITEVRKELQDITALQTSLLGKMVTTLEGYGYQPALDEVLITKVLVQ